MSLIKQETFRRAIRLEDYKGTYNGCQEYLEMDEMMVIEIGKTEEYTLAVPIDILYCPKCFRIIETLYLYGLRPKEPSKTDLLHI